MEAMHENSTLYDAAMNLESTHSQVIPITMFVAVLCLCLVVGHLLEEHRWINESITSILIGCVAGTIILCTSKWKSSRLLRFNEELFFIYLLPPIIFNAGFQVRKKQFFHNFFPIMLFGVTGVFISTSIVAAGTWWLFPKLGFDGLTISEYLSIGTIFSSTDTVCTLQVLNQDETPLLYSLVFGEGVVNDATSVVLFNAVQKISADTLNGQTALHIFLDFLYLFSTSTFLGVAAGLVTACILRGLYFGRHSSVREIALMVLVAYLSYMLAELFELSGILTVFFAGVLMSHYSWHNVTESSRITTRYAFATLSFIAETFIFLYVGMDALDYAKWKMSTLSFWTNMSIYSMVLLLILLGRAAFVFPLSVFSNFMYRSGGESAKITGKHQIVIWWAGLMRGAVSIALVFKQVFLSGFCKTMVLTSLPFWVEIVIWWAGLMRGAVSIALAFKQFTHSGVTLDPKNATMITTTIVIVLFSTVVFGFLTTPLVDYLLPPGNSNTRRGPRDTGPKEDMTLPLLSLDESASENLSRAKDNISMLVDRPVYTIHSYWRRFDNAYMRPVFGGPPSNESSC